MQANWWQADTSKLVKEVPLRDEDILDLIDAGKQWYERKPFHSLPVDVAHVSSSLRLVLVNCGDSDKKKEGGTGEELSVLVNSGAGSLSTSLPVAMDGDQLDPIREALKVYRVYVVINVTTILDPEKKNPAFKRYNCF